MLKVVMLKGLPASGKSTYAKELVKNNGFVRVNKDDLRAMLHNSKWSKGNEAQVLRMRDAIVLDCLHNGRSVVVDDTNLNPIHAQALSSMAKSFKAEFETKFFDTPIEECIKRDLQRPVSVGERVIRQQYNQWLRKPAPVQTFDPNLPPVILCDIDGTLAHMGTRSPFAWDLVGNDTIDQTVLQILRTYEGAPLTYRPQIIMLSGRDSVCRQQTLAWLDKYEVPYNDLFMRAKGDMRKDNIVKRELYEQHIAGKYNVLFVLDDRNQVVDMWRNELGLKVLQVAEGDF